GVNLTHDSYDHDRGVVIERGFAAGVRQMIVTGASLASTQAAIALTAQYPRLLFATAGVHPHHAAEWDAALAQRIAAAARSSAVVAVGECGLDYFRDLAPRAAQRRAFEAQLALAAETGKPVFLHQRDAHDDFLAMLRGLATPLAGVAHCFTGEREQM